MFKGRESCGLCRKEFKTQTSVDQHQRARNGQCRFERYYQIRPSQAWNERLDDFHDDKANLCIGSRRKSKGVVEGTLDDILGNPDNRGRYATKASLEGSYKTGLKIGKPDEFDFSVELLLPGQPRVGGSSQSVGFRYTDDDIDHWDQSPGKRALQERQYESADELLPPLGYRVVQLKKRRTKRFADSVIEGVLVPYEVLVSFHEFVLNAVNQLEKDHTVVVAKNAHGPAISLLIKHPSIVHRISVDLAPVIYIDRAGPILRDHGWPRNATRNWLTDAKMASVDNTQIYLVAKGDKFWRISFARCEDELLKDVDGPGVDGTRKRCLRICKMKLKQWKSKSNFGLKGISSYMLKTVMLWMCEIFPDNEDWQEDELSARYMCFMLELHYCFKHRYLGEYFIPSINLLAGKEEDAIGEMIEFVEKELNTMMDMFVDYDEYNHFLTRFSKYNYHGEQYIDLMHGLVL